MKKIDITKLSKEELIAVIANMHDTIQEWNNGYGLSEKEGDQLVEIGNSATQFCNENNNWELPTESKENDTKRPDYSQWADHWTEKMKKISNNLTHAFENIRISIPTEQKRNVIISDVANRLKTGFTPETSQVYVQFVKDLAEEIKK